MKRAWFIAVLTLTVLALAGAGLTITGLPLSGPAQAASVRPAATAERTVVFDCSGHALARPKNFVLACADGNSAVEQLSWSAWAPGLASAKGTLVQNDCVPYCAAGHFHRYPALVILWGSKAVRPGEHAYPKLTLILTGPRPGYYDATHHKWVYAPVTQTFPLLTSFPGA